MTREPKSGRTPAVTREVLSQIGGSLRRSRHHQPAGDLVLWDRTTGEPLHAPSYGRTGALAEARAELKADGAEAAVQRHWPDARPLFLGGEIRLAADDVPDAREQGERGEVAWARSTSCCGTYGGRPRHRRNQRKAGRSLFDIHASAGTSELCRLFRVPEAVLPEVRHRSELFGMHGRRSKLSCRSPGMAGDQQADRPARTAGNGEVDLRHRLLHAG